MGAIMPQIDCPSRIELDSFQAGNLNEPRLSSLESHVEGCSTCQRALETVIGESADSVLAALLTDAEPDAFATEASCRTAVERVTAMARELSANGGEDLLPLPVGEGRGEGALLPVESIREYQLLAKLGEGGMGAVYKALHTRLDKVVALKVLPAERMRDTGAVARFQREMKAVGKLDHPNIVRAMDAGEEAGMHFLVMEYVEGLDLSQLAKLTGPLPIADACELVRQAALGLAEAHEHGMVHRDIKPSNLILAKPRKKKGEPTVKILDLGLALLSEALAPDAGGLTTSGQMMGTIDYMAPEQGGDSHQVDIRADIYSLGATLYKLLTGVAPFAGEKFDTPVKKLMALATQSPNSIRSLRPDVPAPLAQIIERMLAKNPADRFATPEELIDALAPFCTAADLSSLSRRAHAASITRGEATSPLAPGGRGVGGEGASWRKTLHPTIMSIARNRARSLRRNLTETERFVWARLRDRRFEGFKFRRQTPLGDYILDFVCFDCRVIVELDGGQHNDPAAIAYDTRRTQWLESEGFRVLRFWNHDVLQDWEAVEEVIWQALVERRGLGGKDDGST